MLITIGHPGHIEDHLSPPNLLSVRARVCEQMMMSNTTFKMIYDEHYNITTLQEQRI